ncbi:MAG: HAD family phosphatase [Planctomycetes bacterium]|nr:HAD family phosphatase [Planctomycetota bacterium]
MKYRMLVADMDGTVLDSRHEVRATTVEALRRIEAAGCRVILATGRNYRTALPVAQRVGLDRPLICLNGGLVKHPRDHSTIETMTFDPATARGVAETLLATGAAAFAFVDGYGEQYDFAYVPCGGPSPDAERFLEFYSGRYVVTDLDGASEAIGRCIEMGTIADAETLRRCGAAVRARFDSQVHQLIIYAPNIDLWLFEAFAAGVNKWAAALRLAERWGIAPDEIAAVGDDINDVEMVRGAALGIAMGNAAECVRNVADRVAPTNDQGGLETVAQWLLESRS